MAQRRKYPLKPKCRVCLEYVGADGVCLHRCDPALARPGVRGHARSAMAEPMLQITREERERTAAVLREVDVFFRRDSDKARRRAAKA